MKKEWTNFTILYVKGHSLSRVNNVMMMGNDTDQMTISVRELTGDDYRFIYHIFVFYRFHIAIHRKT